MVHQKENVTIHSIIFFFKQIGNCTHLSKKFVQINIFLKMRVSWFVLKYQAMFCIMHLTQIVTPRLAQFSLSFGRAFSQGYFDGSTVRILSLILDVPECLCFRFTIMIRD